MINQPLSQTFLRMDALETLPSQWGEGDQILYSPDICRRSHHNLCCNHRLPGSSAVHTFCRYTHMYCPANPDCGSPYCNTRSPEPGLPPNPHTTQTRATHQTCKAPSHTRSTQCSQRPTPHSYSHISLAPTRRNAVTIAYDASQNITDDNV